MSRHIIVDGRVFATEAADRGMGRYVMHLLALLGALGHRVTLIVPPATALAGTWPAGTESRSLALEDDPILGTARLNRFLERAKASAYVDATPFLAPQRYDVHVCPALAVLYDLIPMRYPRDYFDSFGPGALDPYINGLARVRKADHVIAISEYVKRHALRYLGVSRNRCTVIVPDVGPVYRQSAREGIGIPDGNGSIVCIQGAHRSKNFPAAIRFLEDLSQAANCDVDVIVPTAAQRGLVDNVRRGDFPRVRVANSITEERKLSLQRNARAIAHLSLDEGYGIPLAEALCLHRPIVCIDSAINRELIAGCDDPQAAGILLLAEPGLDSHADLRAAVRFVGAGSRPGQTQVRQPLIEALLARQAQAANGVVHALADADARFDEWRKSAGLAIVAPTEIGSCGVSDYCHALTRGGSPRHVLLLGTAPRELQTQRQLRLLPVSLIESVRACGFGVLLNLAVSDSLARGFDAIAEGSSPKDVLVVHDAGSYLPGLLMQAAASGDRRQLFERYLVGEPDDVRALSTRWLNAPYLEPQASAALFLELDQQYRSSWLRAFRGRVVSHHSAFADRAAGNAEGILALLSRQSEILRRARYAAMPIDDRAHPALARLADKMRWALGVEREDMLVCCAGSVVHGKHLDVVARVVARLDARPRTGAITLLLAGRVLDEALYAALREQFSACGESRRLVQVVERDETRYDALLMASDVIVAFREQRRIQMSHSYVRALSLGRPIVTNGGAGFDDLDAAVVCRDDHLDADLERHLTALSGAASVRLSLAASSQARYRIRHTLDAFFADVANDQSDADAAAAFQSH